ncbi:hypothetical protein C8Q80DRAFT_542064 [Daedaleopsis nitida]|nr:hypothetical protein C8Q80DRAFT_542064 [Daedaleopsis nitida]
MLVQREPSDCASAAISRRSGSPYSLHLQVAQKTYYSGLRRLRQSLSIVENTAHGGTYLLLVAHRSEGVRAKVIWPLTRASERMPRLIPRLLRRLEHARSLPPKPPRKVQTQRSTNDTSATRVFTRPDEVDISPTGRSQSILLDRDALRLIYRHGRYRRDKPAAPAIRTPRTWSEANQTAPAGSCRAMTLEERQFYANPYLRMLGSPLRRCLQSDTTLPQDLLVGLAPMLIPGERSQSVLLPTRIEHPKFRHSRGGRTRYLLCSKYTLELALKTGGLQRWKPDSHKHLAIHALLVQQVGHSLRTRVLQELHILARHLRGTQRSRSPPLLRRLTRAEWNEVKTSGIVPYENAVAILVVPPVNKDPETKERPIPNNTSMPVQDDLKLSHPPARSYPLSVLYPTSEADDLVSSVDHLHLLPPARVPVYNGVPLFPSRTQRAALRLALSRVLNAERLAKASGKSQLFYRDRPAFSIEGTKGDQRASHAILVCSDEKTLFRGDTVPLAIALWRLRMWEASEGSKDTPAHWIIGPPRTS